MKSIITTLFIAVALLACLFVSVQALDCTPITTTDGFTTVVDGVVAANFPIQGNDVMILYSSRSQVAVISGRHGNYTHSGYARVDIQQGSFSTPTLSCCGGQVSDGALQFSGGKFGDVYVNFSGPNTSCDNLMEQVKFVMI